jgi:chromosome segregation ATPase
MRSNNASLRPATGLEENASPKTQFINTQGSLGSLANTGSASLKGKLLSLEEMVRSITEEMNFHKKEVQVLRSEKDTLESVLNMKINDVRKSLMNEIARVEDEMKRHFAHQKAENSRLQQQITQLKGEKTALQQQLLALQRRISELETQIGAEDA